MTRRAEWKVAKFEMGRLRHQKTIRDVFIFGDPGTGKTTLVNRVGQFRIFRGIGIRGRFPP